MLLILFVIIFFIDIGSWNIVTLKIYIKIKKKNKKFKNISQVIRNFYGNNKKRIIKTSRNIIQTI